MPADLSDRERDILRHSLGIKNAKLPKGRLAYRNHFAANPGSDDHATILGLVERGLMEPGPKRWQLDFFHVTPAGMAAVSIKGVAD